MRERTLYDGTVHTPLDEDGVRAAVEFFAEQGVEALAIGFLHSYANPGNERRAADICREVAPGMYVTASHEILAVWREFERFSTTVVSATVGPAISRYLPNLERRLREEGFRGTLLMVTASGVVQTPAACIGQAVQLVGSGPAAMPAAAIHVGLGVGVPNLLSIDMGGTSLDVSLIAGGRVPTTSENWFGEERIAIKAVDVHSVGAGGGSIAWLDPLGMLQVGPRSAGADPGPACYGKGNLEPTVTDANVVLGFVPTDDFLGGALAVDRELAVQAVARLGDRLGLGTIETANAILATVNSRMADRIRESSTNRGHDIRDFTLVAGGGAGPVHGAFLARTLGIGRVIVPPTAGLLGAFGMLVMDLGRDFARAYIARIQNTDPDAVDRLFAEMTVEASAAIGQSGISPEQVTYTRSADMRYVRQFHEVEVDIPAGRFDAQALADTVSGFHSRHEAVFTFSMPWQDVEFLTLRLRATVAAQPLRVPPRASGSSDASESIKHTRSCWFDGRAWDTAVYDGPLLAAGNRIQGPAIIEESTTSVVVPPGCVCSVDEASNLLIDVGAPV